MNTSIAAAMLFTLIATVFYWRFQQLERAGTRGPSNASTRAISTATWLFSVFLTWYQVQFQNSWTGLIALVVTSVETIWVWTRPKSGRLGFMTLYWVMVIALASIATTLILR